MWYGDNRFPNITFAPNQGFPTIVLFANSGPSLSWFSLKCKLLWLISGWANWTKRKELAWEKSTYRSWSVIRRTLCFVQCSVFRWSFWNIKALYWEIVLSCFHNRFQAWEIELLSQSKALTANKSKRKKNKVQHIVHLQWVLPIRVCN